MKRIVFIVFILGISLISFAQQRELRGLVKVNNSETNTGIPEYIEGVIIQYINVRQVLFSSEKTGTDGQFRLYITGVAGNPQISLNVVFDEKNKDYHVVNKEIISDITLIRDTPIEILVFSRTKAEKLKQQAIEKILQPEKEKLAEMANRLNSEQQTNTFLRDSITNQVKKIEELTKTVNNTLDYWLRLDLDKSDKDYKQAYQLAMEGKFEESNQFIPKDEDIIQNINTKIEQLQKNSKLRIENFKALSDVINVVKEYKSIIENSNDNDEVMQARKELVDYRLQVHDYSEEARKENEDILKISSVNIINNIVLKIHAYNSQYGLDKNSNNQEIVKNAYKNLIEAIRQYAKTKKEYNNEILRHNHYAIEKEAAISYALFAKYYQEKEKYELAKHNYLKAHDIYIELNKIGEIEIFNQRLCLLRLAQLFQQDRKESLAQQCFRRANILADVENDSVQSDEEAQIYTEIAHLQLGKKDFNTAISKYKSVLAYYEKQNDRLPVIYEQRLIKAYFNLGIAYYFSQGINNTLRFKTVSIPYEAEIYLKEGLELIRQSKNSEEYKRLEVLFYAAIGSVYEKNNKKELATEYLNKANQFANDVQLRKDVKYINRYGTGYDWERILINTGLVLFFSVEFLFMLYLPTF